MNSVQMGVEMVDAFYAKIRQQEIANALLPSNQRNGFEELAIEKNFQSLTITSLRNYIKLSRRVLHSTRHLHHKRKTIFIHKDPGFTISEFDEIIPKAVIITEDLYDVFMNEIKTGPDHIFNIHDKWLDTLGIERPELLPEIRRERIHDRYNQETPLHMLPHENNKLPYTVYRDIDYFSSNYLLVHQDGTKYVSQWPIVNNIRFPKRPHWENTLISFTLGLRFHRRSCSYMYVEAPYRWNTYQRAMQPYDDQVMTQVSVVYCACRHFNAPTVVRTLIIKYIDPGMDSHHGIPVYIGRWVRSMSRVCASIKIINLNALILVNRQKMDIFQSSWDSYSYDEYYSYSEWVADRRHCLIAWTLQQKLYEDYIDI
jgi:hypothetical protein